MNNSTGKSCTFFRSICAKLEFVSIFCSHTVLWLYFIEKIISSLNNESRSDNTISYRVMVNTALGNLIFFSFAKSAKVRMYGKMIFLAQNMKCFPKIDNTIWAIEGESLLKLECPAKCTNSKSRTSCGQRRHNRIFRTVSHELTFST